MISQDAEKQPDPQQASAADIQANLAEVRNRMAAAAQRVGRDPAEITLVAVSKTHPSAMIRAALDVGQSDFGENRLNELWMKIVLSQNLEWDKGDNPIRWHFIGSIQSRKAEQVVGPLVLIHSVDRVKIARIISDTAVAAGTVMQVLLEVNVSGEESKHGFTPETLADAVAAMRKFEGIQIQGLMTMAPFVDDPEETRPVFRGLRLLRDALRGQFPDLALPHLSMGMTNDFEVAIEEGATLVRVGTAIFGAAGKL